MMGRARRSIGRAWISIRRARELVAVHWREADRLDRLQIAGAAALVLLVFGVFGVGAITREHAGVPAGGLALEEATGKQRAERAGRPGGEKSPPGGASAAAGGSKPGASSARHPVEPLPSVDDDGRADDQKGKAPDDTPQPDPRDAPEGTTPVVIGVAHRSASATAALATALGLDAPGDAALQARAVADWINADGGVRGRPVELRVAAFDPTASVSYASAFSAACAVLAGGAQRPAAVVGAIEDPASQAGCLGSRGIALVGGGPAPGDSALFQSAAGNLVAPGSMAIDRLAAAQIEALLADGFFRGGRVGIVRLDGAHFARTATDTVRPALERAGVPVAAEEVLPAARTVGDAAAMVLRAPGAAARLRVAGVNRVIMLDAGIAAATFMRAADSQSFRPRYALNSTMAPASLVGRVPDGQLHEAAGVGVAPLLDVTAEAEPPANRTRARCDGIYRDAGVPVGDRTASGRYAAIALCDALLAVRAALSRDVDMTRVAQSLGALGESHTSAVALASRLGARRDGAAAIRRVRYDGGCRCMRYVGEAEAIR